MVARPARPLTLTSVPALIVVDALCASYTRVLETRVAPAAAEQERIEVDAPAVECAVDNANLRVCQGTDVDRSRMFTYDRSRMFTYDRSRMRAAA